MLYLLASSWGIVDFALELRLYLRILDSAERLELVVLGFGFFLHITCCSTGDTDASVGQSSGFEARCRRPVTLPPSVHTFFLFCFLPIISNVDGWRNHSCAVCALHIAHRVETYQVLCRIIRVGGRGAT